MLKSFGINKQIWKTIFSDSQYKNSCVTKLQERLFSENLIIWRNSGYKITKIFTWYYALAMSCANSAPEKLEGLQHLTRSALHHKNYCLRLVGRLHCLFSVNNDRVLTLLQTTLVTNYQLQLSCYFTERMQEQLRFC